MNTEKKDERNQKGGREARKMGQIEDRRTEGKQAGRKKGMEGDNVKVERKESEEVVDRGRYGKGVLEGNKGGRWGNNGELQGERGARRNEGELQGGRGEQRGKYGEAPGREGRMWEEMRNVKRNKNCHTLTMQETG